MEFTTAELTRSLQPKTIDNFYVEFLNFENNYKNILGRQVTSLERPTMTFNAFTTRIKQAQISNSAQITFTPFNVTFRDDDQNITMKVLTEQLYRQNGVVGPLRNMKTFDKAKFNMMVKVYNSTKEPVETFTIVGCYIVALSNSQSIYASATQNIITCQVQCDTIDFGYVQDYVDATYGPVGTNELP